MNVSRFVPATVLALALVGCVETVPEQRSVVAGDLPPIQRDYEGRILSWARGYFAEPHRLAATRITEPLLARDERGRLLWLVCVEAASHVSGDGYRPARRYAFGFAPPDYVSAPLARRDATIVADDCEDPGRRWRAFPALGRL